ncbi:pilus assembly protein [Streptomyces sp. S07_1.15]|uniref:TadE family protein n=1 Tax=Streptomyces sp. S07_1.15 TaxID=2873925 RepID=UPI001D137973|nr:TadE family protein [Streptomyces sp. S07_1.15]MCC3655759.1 pilus assembly protein [Streptomyces sp. S07_1.15]
MGPWSRLRRRCRGDRGDASVQMAIVFPFVIIVTVAVVQASQWYFAREIALTAAREGLAAARTYGAGPGDGAARARSVLNRIAGDSLRGAAVSTAGSDGQRIRIQVSGRAPSMLPGIADLTITQSASGPVERWTTPGS